MFAHVCGVSATLAMSVKFVALGDGFMRRGRCCKQYTKHLGATTTTSFFIIRMVDGKKHAHLHLLRSINGTISSQGTFRLACEHVLKTLKKGRETLLTLLEAFVYDPLVDWAIGEEGVGGGAAAGGMIGGAAGAAVSVYGGEALGSELRQARRLLEHEVSRDTMALRLAELRPEWLKNG